MIIVCDSCGTRFHLADGRVGPKGAKVRCSNCHHRFQVPPAEKPAGERREGEHSPVPSGGSSDPDAARSRKPVGDPDLDNPRFLFDGDPSNHTTLPDGPRGIVGDISPSDEFTQRHDFAGADAPTPASKRAATPLLGLDPEVSARQQELLQRSSDEASPETADDAITSKSLFDFGREDDFEPTPAPGREPKLVADLEKMRAPGVAPSAPSPAPDADEVDEAISRWDAPVASAPSPPRSVEVLRAAPLRVRRAPAPARVEPARVGKNEAEDPVAVPIRPQEPFTPRSVHVAAITVGIVLAGAALRLSLRPPLAPPPAGAVQGMGWTAHDLRARSGRDVAGDPTLQIEGVLRGPAGAPLPRVRVLLVDGEGAALMPPVEARVGPWGATATGDPQPLRVSTAGSAAANFHVAVPAPPPRAERFRIEIDAAPAPPADPPRDATTTARPQQEPALVSPPPEPTTSEPAAPAAPVP